MIWECREFWIKTLMNSVMENNSVQQGGNSNGFGAGESLGSPLLICTSVMTKWKLVFFVLSLNKSPLFPQNVYCNPNYVTALLHSCWHTQAELLTDVSAVHCFCSEAGGGQGISRGCCCSWLTIPLPSSKGTDDHDTDWQGMLSPAPLE